MKTMPNRQVLYYDYGQTDSLAWVTTAFPERPGRGRVRLRIQYVGLNPFDWRVLAGQFRWLCWKWPRGIGCDASAIIADLGSNVDNLAVGQLVTVMVNPFAYWTASRYLDVPAGLVVPVPSQVSPQQAAALPTAFTTAVRAWPAGNRLRRPNCLIVGAGGGVGNLLCQMAISQNWLVHGVANPEKFAQIGLNIAAVYDYKSVDPVDLPHRYDYVFDCHGALLDNRVRRILQPGGKLINVCVENKDILKAACLPLSGVKNKLVLAVPSTKILARGLDLVARQSINPAVGAVYDWTEAAQALAALKAGRHFGKVLIDLQNLT